MRRRLLSIFLITLLLLTSVPHYAFAATVLKTGSRGSAVAEMQQRLIQLGYLSGKADGIFGPATEGAVKSFQSAHGLAIDGIAGSKTLGILYGTGAKPAGSGTSSGETLSGGGASAPPAGTAPIQRTLRRGDRGSDVAALQKRLNELKYNAGTPDGVFGPATENVVRAFQRDRGLATDGIVGSQTTAALFSGSSAPPADSPGGQNPPATGGGSANPITTVLKRGSKGSQVTALQNKLNELGYNCGAADGVFGQATYQAVVNFQRTNNLAADGIVGSATASRLFSVQSGSGSSPEPTKPAPSPDPVPELPENPASDDLKGKIVIIDPGHGGKDPGACHGGLQEKDLALDMGLRLRKILEQAGATVYMTRSDDRYVSLFYRSAFANKVVLDMESKDVKAKKAEATESVGKKQAALSQAAEDQADLEEYAQALEQLKDAKSQKNGTKAQWALQDLSSRVQSILDSNLQDLKEGLAVLGIEYENKSLAELSDAVEEYSGTEQECKTQLQKVIEEIEEVTGSAQTIASIEKEIGKRNNDSARLPVRIEDAEELRSGLRQQLRDTIHLGNEALTQENISELDERISSIKEAIRQIDAEEDTLEQDARTLNGKITEYGNNLTELNRLLNAFQAYFNDPSLNSRTGIYHVVRNGTSNIASDDLKKVMDLTREKYQDNMVFVAIHLNATNAPETSASGIYTFYRDSQPGSYNNADYYENYNSAARIRFATKLLQEAGKVTNFSKKQSAPHNDDFSVLRENNVVSSLVEVGFMNNSNDLSLVSRPEFRENVAYGLFRGIVEYFR